uniref:IclR family transcriptional regulator domain-containing protein n=1 Tax=Streptomyces olivochromogenes TaxID=1963 RepID=UPI0035B14197
MRPTHVQEDFLTADPSAREDEERPTGEALRAELAAIRRNRYAVFSRSPRQNTITGVAAPVLDRHDNTVAAVSIVGPTERSRPAHIPAVVTVARVITHALATDAVRGSVPGA